MNNTDSMKALFTKIGQGSLEAVQVAEDALEEGYVRKSKTVFRRVVEKARKFKGQAIPARVVPNQFVEITPGVSIRIVFVKTDGTFDRKTKTWVDGPVGFDKTFKIGDQASHGSYNMIYHEAIEKISANCVTIDGTRMDIAKFVKLNYNFDLAYVEEYNNRESLCI